MATSDLLLVLDASEGDRIVIDHAVRLLRRGSGARVCLFCLLPPLPPELLEFGGAEDPRREERLETGLKERQREWAARADAQARQALKHAAAELAAAGVPAPAIEERIAEESVHPHPADPLADEILAVARAGRYGRILVRRGQEAATGEDLAAALAARATDVTVDVVE